MNSNRTIHCLKADIKWLAKAGLFVEVVTEHPIGTYIFGSELIVLSAKVVAGAKLSISENRLADGFGLLPIVFISVVENIKRGQAFKLAVITK